jgi:hypothetical protein
VLPDRHVLFVGLLPGGNEDNFVQLEVSSYLTRGNEVTVVNGVERPTHDSDSSARGFDRHAVGLVVPSVVVAPTRVAVSYVTKRENDNRQRDKPGGENPGPHNRGKDERREFFGGGDDGVHNVLPTTRS